MIDVDPLIVSAIEGSSTPAVQVTAWRDGVLTYPTADSAAPAIDVLSWSVTEDATQMARSCSFSLAALDPVLLPTTMDGVLMPFGSEVSIRSGVDLGPAGVKLAAEGIFRITRAKPRKWYEYYSASDKWVLQGLAVDGSGTDRTKVLEDARFEATPVSSEGSSVFAAIAALCADLVPVGTHRVSNRSITPIAFDGESRTSAIDAVAKYADARAVIDREGRLILKPRTRGSGSWGIPSASLIDVEEEVSDEGFYNGVVAKGRDPQSQQEIVGKYYEQDRSVGWRSGHKVPYFYSSPLLTTQAAADSAAHTTYLNVVKRRQTVVQLDVPAHPGIEALDEVTWERAGIQYSGSVKTVTRSGGKSDGGLMRLGVWVPLETARSMW